MAVVKVYHFDTGFSQIPNKTARDKHISNTARGMLLYLTSNKDGYKFLKMELYTDFGRREVDNTFKELEEHGYLYPIKFRVGKKYEPFYFVCVRPFLEEERKRLYIQALTELQIDLKGKYIWDVQFGQFILDCPKRTTSKEKDLKNKKSLNQIKDDDDKLSTIQLIEIVNKVHESFPASMISEEQFKGVVTKILAKYESNKIGNDKFEPYLISSLNNRMAELDKKKMSKKRKATVRKELTPDWLDEERAQYADDQQEDIDYDEMRKKIEERRKRMEKVNS